MNVLSTESLSKNYHTVQALNAVSLQVPERSVYGILGPNGSGKTTLLGIVMDVLKATAGAYLWNGNAGSSAQRKRIGTLLETPNFYPYLSGERNLEIAASIKGYDKTDIDRVLKIVNLYERRQSAFSTYSLGMKQRLAIAAALLGDPETLVFDEPTNGLDPAGIAEIRQLIRDLNAAGKTIIMASHILDEVEKVCTHVTILQKGNVKASGTVADVLHTDEAATEQLLELKADDLGLLATVLKSMEGINRVLQTDGTLQAWSILAVSPAAVNKYCFENGVLLSHLSIKKKNLETRFLEITGKTSDR